MAEHFKLIVTPKGTKIITFTGVDENFAQQYGDMLGYAKALASDKNKDEEETENKYYKYKNGIFIPKLSPPPFTMEYVFAEKIGPPTLEEYVNRQKNIEARAQLQTKNEKNTKIRKEKPIDPESWEGKYARYNYNKRIKERAASFRSYAFINFTKNITQFVTLTFDPNKIPNANSLDVAHDCFRKFIKRVQSKFSDFKYLGTFSRQKNDNWHYHLLCNFDETVTNKEIENMWQYGYIHATLITANDELYTKISYCIDNMYKVSFTDLIGEKGYVRSHHLQDHIVLRSWNEKESEMAFNLLHDILQSTLDKPTPRNSVLLKKGESFFTRLGSSTGEPLEIVEEDTQINYLYSTKGFPELFKLPQVAKRKSQKKS